MSEDLDDFVIIDRRVHAVYDGMEIVRYNRTSHWYLEPTNPKLKRQQVKIKAAVRSAIWGIDNANGRVLFGRPGGTVFDRLVSRAFTARAYSEETR